MASSGLRSGIVLLLLAVPTAGPAAGTPETLTWENCLKIGASRNPSLVSAREQVKSKEDLYSVSVNALLPNLSLGYSYSNSSSGLNPVGNSRLDNWQSQVQGNLQWDLFNGKDYAGIQLASAGLAQARFQEQLSSSQVRFKIKSTFYQLLFAQNQIALLDHILQIRQSNADMVRLEYDSGRESKGNMLITKADLASAGLDLAQARRSLRIAQEALNLALGREGGESILIQAEFYLPAEPKWEAIAARLPNTPQIKQDEAVVSENQALLRQAWSQVLPNVSAQYGRGWLGTALFPQNNEWNASLNLSWPIFAGGPTFALSSISSAQALLTKAEADQQSDRRQLFATAQSDWSNLALTIDQVAVQKQYLEAARQRNDEAGIEYSNGLLTFENWNQVVTSLVAFEKQYLSSRLNAVLAENDWENAFETTLEEP